MFSKVGKFLTLAIKYLTNLAKIFGFQDKLESIRNLFS